MHGHRLLNKNLTVLKSALAAHEKSLKQGSKSKIDEPHLTAEVALPTALSTRLAVALNVATDLNVKVSP